MNEQTPTNEATPAPSSPVMPDQELTPETNAQPSAVREIGKAMTTDLFPMVVKPTKKVNNFILGVKIGLGVVIGLLLLGLIAVFVAQI